MKIFHLLGLHIILFVCVGYGLAQVPDDTDAEQIKRNEKAKTDVLGEPLFLTPLLEAGKADRARELSYVEPFLSNKLKSYAGFFTVNKTYDSNHFIWFFPAAENLEKAPTVVWLEGGPGTKALFGEHGPYGVKEDGKTLFLREYAWTKTFSMLYIDNPVGTGYSYTKDDRGYCKTEEDIAENLYSTVYQFFQMFPQLLHNELYIIGESYGGKYGPSLAYAIHERNKVSSIKINLKGVAVGAGFTDPIHMLDYGNFLYGIGLIDLHVKKQVDELMDECRQNIRNGEMVKAYNIWHSFLDSGIGGNTPGLFTNATGFKNYYHYLRSGVFDISKEKNVGSLPFVRKNIHVGNLTFHTGAESLKNLEGDFLRSVAPWVTVLLDNNYKFIMYSAQLDICVSYHFIQEYLENLEWKGAAEFKNATRHIWKVEPKDEEVAGYVRSACNLIEVMVRNAGHAITQDQPRATYDLVNRFVFNKPFY